MRRRRIRTLVYYNYDEAQTELEVVFSSTTGELSISGSKHALARLCETFSAFALTGIDEDDSHWSLLTPNSLDLKIALEEGRNEQ